MLITVEFGHNVMKGERIFCVVITEECNVMVNSEELIGTTKYRTLYAGCRINRSRYNRSLQYMVPWSEDSKLNPA